MGGPQGAARTFVATIALVCAGCDRGASSTPAAEPARTPAAAALAIELTPALRAAFERASPLPPLPPDPTNRVADDLDAAEYGRRLFFDPRFSRDGSVACATCHVPETGFTDGRALAVGLAEGNRHTPSLWNAAHHRWLTWDGRADSLWMQALDPLEDEREMGTTRVSAVRLVAHDGELREKHEAVFGPLPSVLEDADLPAHARPALRGEGDDPAVVQAWLALPEATRAAVDRVFVEMAKALAAYQRRLVRGDSPFDRFARGLREDDGALVGALEPAAQRGAALFFGRANCVLCHSGPNFSDGEFHNNSLPTLDGAPPRDSGRFGGAAVVKASPLNAAGVFSDAPDGDRARAVRLLRTASETWGEFRTPSLRNLADRAPFMHQGQLQDLDAVLNFYSTLEGQSARGHHQERVLVPLQLSPEERRDLLAFLASLEGAPIDSIWTRP